MEGGEIPADYKVTVTRGGKPVATFTASQLSELAGQGGRRRGPGPTLADLLVAAHVDDRSRTLVIDGYSGDHIEISAADALDEPGSCEISLTQRSTAKLDCGGGQVRHVATIAVR